MKTGNLYGQIPTLLPEELVEVLGGAGNVRIERIVSRGHCSPPDFWYDQDLNEWVALLKGEALLRFERDGRLVRLAEGDHVRIAAHERHRVEWTKEDTDTVWIAVFY
ncbi:MAG TPA: cupin domain-containing protein [Noviherbaspirillum sp.]|uniref:cupin domain-containing protein n=1 Tax=Noviherbaspirillum sp. TaxID=1926288 RepID=UPI002D549DD2|nr:cupin domain-containing protein [Noviherbaspirillum sp.]HYD94138.1 cupin domain-containing protein [Noviherbaspirillum sp.]